MDGHTTGTLRRTGGQNPAYRATHQHHRPAGDSARSATAATSPARWAVPVPVPVPVPFWPTVGRHLCPNAEEPRTEAGEGSGPGLFTTVVAGRGVMMKWVYPGREPFNHSRHVTVVTPSTGE